ncbi:MFS transporter, PAT family, beta-lactamase induction signal transducer AmpG [Erythrobacter litoralis]|uniref:Beta-lactamase n=1 Tax=Erythrobacter litoralis TaxID=39960 RepID=A0A074MCU6_9SPHN|nr:MFS transporter [Erythrobacter litoralis]AOL23253.1 MFS transporter, PAT family, beta-lactamase induction signal transducer AmpG [Erythrobacter litoralis]KEO92601.1 beta-lactamase [Erythrobacter litoralis]
MAEATGKKPGWRELVRAMGQPKTGYMALFGFASGLPFALFLGTLYAWLSEAEVDLETMGVFSLIGLAYAFQFLWSPLIDKVNIAGFHRLGRRKQWMVPAQLLLGAILVTLSLLEPRTQLGWFSLLAGIGAFASATQDIAINAWRIDVADEKATLDILSTVYQLGYRLAALVGGAFGLIIAARIGWPETYALMGAILLAIGSVGLFAPDTPSGKGEVDEEADEQLLALRKTGELRPEIRARALGVVALLWAGAIAVVLTFMIMSLAFPPEERPNPTEFTLNFGPWIIIATVVVPALIAGWLAAQKRDGKNLLTSDEPPSQGGGFVMDHLYRALVLPLVEFVGRMGWSLVLILALVLTYRICDQIWGTFAYPFYLGELEYSNDEVAFASKFFGVFAILAGLAVGGFMLTLIGRMATLTIGALLAALTNLLYADLAVGGANMQMVSDAVGFSWAISQVPVIGSANLAKLTFTIFFENLAIGLAGAAFVAYLSSIVSKRYSAVQYALLSSLTLLVGTLGRGALGEMIEDRGYFDVFVLTTFIGLVAVVLCLAEWWRQSRLKGASGVVTPEAQPAE